MEDRSLSLINVLDEVEAFVASIPPFPGTFQGRGIIICGGGSKYFPGAWVCIRMLRKFGCTLPIQIWFLGEKELNPRMRELVAPFGVECIDALQLRETKPCRRLIGWELKAYAVLHTTFREVLLLDADNVPVRDPTYLFEAPEYTQRGAIFWPDIERFSEIPPSFNPEIWKALGMVPPIGEPEFESGQLLINKELSWRPLNLAMWFNEFSDFFYKYVYGDKETFHLAWKKLGVPFAMPSRPIHWSPATMSQHDLCGRRLFQHRNEAKWRLGRNRALPGFWFESDCLIYLWELASQWNGLVRDVPRMVLNVYTPKSIASEVRLLVSRPYVYQRVGHDQRLMTFSANGTIGQGSGAFETYWDVQLQHDAIWLYISSDSNVTCKLRKGQDDTWEGNWEIFERMSVRLSQYSAMRYDSSRFLNAAIEEEARMLISGTYVYVLLQSE